MFRIAVIGLAAAAALTLGAASASSAKLNVVIGVPLGGVGVYGGGVGLYGVPYGYPIYHPGYLGPDCHQVTVWNGKYKKNGKKKFVNKTICD